MAKRKVLMIDADSGKYGIRVTHNDGVVGWIVGQDGEVLLFKTEKEAQKRLNAMRKDNRYSWNCNVEVAEFAGFGKKTA